MALTIQEISKVQLVKNNPVPVKVNTDKRPKEKSKPIFDLIFTATTAADGESFTIEYDTISVTMTFRTTPDLTTGLDLSLYASGTLAEFVDDVMAEMKKNPDLFNLFIISRSSPAAEYISLVLRDGYDPDLVNSQTEGVTGMGINLVQSTHINYEENLHLVLIVEKEIQGSPGNYNQEPIKHILPVTIDNSNPFVLFDIHTDFNLSYHLPFNFALSTFTPYYDSATDCYQKFKMFYANQFGSPPTIQALQTPTNNEFLALWGSRAYIHHLDNWYAVQTAAGFDAVWLTEQPRTKEVTEGQPEFWYFMPINVANKDYVIKRKEYYLDTTDSTSTIVTINADWGEVQWIKLGFLQMTLSQNPANPTIKYDVWIEVDSVIESEVLTFEIIDTQTDYERFFAFGNSVGGIETVRTTGKFSYSGEYSGKEATRINPTDATDLSRQASLFHYDKRQQKKYKGNVGFYSKEYITHLKDLLLSDSAWWMNMEFYRFEAIVITPGSVKFWADNDDLYSLEFEYMIANEDRGNALIE